MNDLVEAELEELPADVLARFRYISQLIEEFGLERVREPHVKHLRGSLWEMRLKGRDGISRAFVCYRRWPARRSCSSIRQENRENA